MHVSFLYENIFPYTTTTPWNKCTLLILTSAVPLTVHKAKSRRIYFTWHVSVMQQQRRGKRAKVYFPWYSLVFSLVAILFSVFLYVLDRGPALPPWGGKFESIDCHSVELESYKDRGGFIDLRFRSLPSVEYPPEYLPHFLSVQIETPPTKMQYSGDHITNITRTNDHIQFSVVHTWAGPSTITARCLNNKPMVLSGDLSDITNWVPEYSRSDHPGNDHAKFHDVCLEYEKFLYFVQIKGDRPAVPFDNESLRFEMLKWPLEAYRKHKNVSQTQRVCFLVAPLEKVTWKMMVLTMIPLAVSVERNSVATKKNRDPLFIFRKQIPAGAPDALKLLSPSAPVTLDDIMCFDTLLMTATYSTMTIERLENSLKMGVRALRKLVLVDKNESSSSEPTIAIAENLWDVLEGPIKERLPNIRCERVGTGEEHVDKLRETVGRSSILIGDHISSLIHMAWLNESATVLDVTPQEYACNPWAEDMAKDIGLSYRSMFKGSNCMCANFECYPMKGQEPMASDYDIVVDEVVKIMSS